MVDTVQNAPPLPPKNDFCPAEDNPAVLFCCQSYTVRREECLRDGDNIYDARKAARRAYKNAMPPLHGREKIQDFIACLSHAMLMDYFVGSEATSLLYAAQVALGAIEKAAPRPPGRPKSVNSEAVNSVIVNPETVSPEVVNLEIVSSETVNQPGK
jgi:hypothetical protein